MEADGSTSPEALVTGTWEPRSTSDTVNGTSVA